MRVSHETIYLSLFVQSRGALRRERQRYLRTGRAMRYPRGKRLPQGAASSVTPSLSVNDPRRRPTGRFPATGKAIWCSADGLGRWGRWSSAAAAMWCCSRCLTGSGPIACARN